MLDIRTQHRIVKGALRPHQTANIIYIIQRDTSYFNTILQIISTCFQTAINRTVTRACTLFTNKVSGMSFIGRLEPATLWSEDTHACTLTTRPSDHLQWHASGSYLKGTLKFRGASGQAPVHQVLNFNYEYQPVLPKNSNKTLYE